MKTRRIALVLIFVISLVISSISETEVYGSNLETISYKMETNLSFPDYPDRTDIWQPIEFGIRMETPPNDFKKSYMDADCITSRGSKAYNLKSKYLLDYSTGIWTVNGRYCAAVGSYYTRDIGRYFTIVLTNGRMIPCILADCKQDGHTDPTHRQNPNGSVVEFIVNTSSLPLTARKMGDCSYCTSYWDCDIDYILLEGITE